MKNSVQSTKNLFDKKGRRIPFDGMRVFNESPKWYYDIIEPQNNFEDILNRNQEHAKVDSTISVEIFKSVCIKLKEKVINDPQLERLFNGVHVPFICPKSEKGYDVGQELEKISIPSVASSFKASFPDLHFKATLQGSSTKLSGELSVAESSRYEKLIESHESKTIAGWYFPQALQEYDIDSQRKQMHSLPFPNNLVLSGGVDTSAALIGSPGLLINKEFYSPVLCLSGLQHNDKKLMLCYKAYGHHLEFWCMSQMLTPQITQVSEQWSGGLTLFSEIC